MRDSPQRGIEEDWLRRRLEIFLSITVPSVLCQTDTDFTWIIKCHPKTPDWAKKLLSDGPFIASYEEMEQHATINDQASCIFAKLIRKITTDPEIITTRLDSDDAIPKKHIELVKKYAKPNLFLDFSRGIVKNQWGIFVHYKPKVSQFCSFLEHSDHLRTVYHKIHISIRLNECIKNQVDFGWMQHNHTTNITNGSVPGESTTMATFNKKYPYKATTADWDTLHEHYPFLRHEWLKIDHPLFM